MHHLECLRATPADAGTLGSLHSACWRAAYRGIIPDDYLAGFTPEKRTAFYTRLLSAQTSESYILQVDGLPAGLLGLGPAHDEDLPSTIGEIHALYLLPSHWRKGLGREAMDFAVARLRALGYEQASLWVLTENERARRFYEGYGFVPDGAEEPITLGRELTELRYRMRL